MLTWLIALKIQSSYCTSVCLFNAKFSLDHFCSRVSLDFTSRVTFSRLSSCFLRDLLLLFRNYVCCENKCSCKIR